MNRKMTFYSILVLIWVFFLVKTGFNIFSIGLGIFFSLIWMVVFTSFINGKNEFKTKQYFANKYDEENK